MRQLGDSLTGRTQIPVTVDIQMEEDFPQEVKVAFYRISQEAINNIEKHASADSVNVVSYRTSGQVILTVQDNGRGIDPEVTPADRMGIDIMQERAKRIGAILEVTSQVGQGSL